LHYGPLLFALPIADTTDANTGDSGAPWNYALESTGERLGDGDSCEPGNLYYDGRKIERLRGIQHGDLRATLLIDIVTYARPGGAPE